jgi:hypothetical protein
VSKGSGHCGKDQWLLNMVTGHAAQIALSPVLMIWGLQVSPYSAADVCDEKAKFSKHRRRIEWKTQFSNDLS